MRSIRGILVVAGATLAFSVLTSSVSATSPKAFHLEKTCSSDVLCTIQSSSFKAFPAGADVTYTYDDSDPWDGLAFPTIVIGNGSTTGVCDWNQPGPTVLAKCTFGTGSGRLTQFHLEVEVTLDTDSVWHWDGTYWSGNGD